jgi:hypothetical protein
MPVAATPSRRMSWAALKTIRSRAPLSDTAIADLHVRILVGIHSMTAVIASLTMTAVIACGNGSASA